MDDEPAEAALVTALATAPGGVGGGDHDKTKTEGAVAVVAPKGDVVLDVDFATTKAQRPAKAAHRAGPATKAQRPRARAADEALAVPSSFRVDAAALKTRSRYFANLLGDTRFREAQSVTAALAALALDGTDPATADVHRLPRVHIDLDDGAARGVAQKLVFLELLRILHWDGQVVPVALASPAGENTDATDVTNTTKPPIRRPARGLSAKKPTKPKPAKPAKPPAKNAESTQALLPGARWTLATPPTLAELATLAVQADRFDCAEAVAAYVRTLRPRFPAAAVRVASVASVASKDGVFGRRNANGLPGLANEEAVRQKIYVAWVLDQPLRFHSATRELVLHGSRQWAAALAGEDVDANADADAFGSDTSLAPWFDLPDGLEAELQFRRACIVNCLASVPRHFLRLYTSRSPRARRQCNMGYETSAACDSFQLGEAVKFLYHKDLVFLQDFSCSLLSAHAAKRDRARRIVPADYAAVDVAHILAALKQCPAYQLDKHHVNCGLRTRLLPIVEYVQSMLGAASIGLHRHEWAKGVAGRALDSWLAVAEQAGLFDDDAPAEYNDDSDDADDSDDGVPLFGKPRPAGSAGPAGSNAAERVRPTDFCFTRAIRADPRLRIENTMAIAGMARTLFTARRWNWTPND